MTGKHRPPRVGYAPNQQVQYRDNNAAGASMAAQYRNNNAVNFDAVDEEQAPTPAVFPGACFHCQQTGHMRSQCPTYVPRNRAATAYYGYGDQGAGNG